MADLTPEGARFQDTVEKMYTERTANMSVALAGIKGITLTGEEFSGAQTAGGKQRPQEVGITT